MLQTVVTVFGLLFFVVSQEVISGLPASLVVLLQNVLRQPPRSRGQEHTFHIQIKKKKRSKFRKNGI